MRFGVAKGACALLFLLSVIFIYFGLVFFYRPDNSLALIATAGFIVIMAVLIQSLEPMFTAFAAGWIGRRRSRGAILRGDGGEPASMEARLSDLEGRHELTPLELLELVRHRKQKFESLFQELDNDRQDPAT